MDDGNKRISTEEEISVSSTDNRNISDDESLNRSSSVFEDNNCGEPISTHRVVLDFTPVEDDNDDVQRKCCEFWDFVNSRPELNSLIVKPKAETVTDITKTNDAISIPKHTSSSSLNEKENTAVSVLEFVEEKGLIDRAFKSRMATPFCDGGLKDYFDERVSKTSKVRVDVKKRSSNKQKISKDVSLLPPSTTARNMCQMLYEWDLEHPKSMSPPGPVPDLQDSVLNTEVIP